jgi:Fe2+ transport system protein FeoA
MPHSCMAPVTLNDLPEGQGGVVMTNDGASGPARRLAELGFTQGEWVEMLRQGSPMLVRVGETRLSLRDHETHHITVLPIA